MFQLMLVSGAIEMALRLCNEPVFSDLPHFGAADTNSVSGPSGPSVGADQCPVVFRAVASDEDVVQKHLQIWKAGHESLRHLGDGLPPHCGSTAIHGERTVLRVTGILGGLFTTDPPKKARKKI